ncbi:MAG: endonuclease/exonuclease/phosphatase family protein [Acutalibacteraceae bacterium]|nr:endonuclease/exonuclease/phosphatase family protein [Acutalibacteraceae bacterium]
MELKVITFNIRCCDDKNGHSIKERAPRLKAVLDPIDADVIGFQECRNDWEEYIPRDFGNKYEIFLVHRGDDESAPILWKKDKFDLIKKGCFWLSDTPEEASKGWDELYDCYRICMYAVLKDKNSGEQFCFMNTHYGFGDKGQTDSSDLIYKYSKEISNLPTFITGDFNMRPDSAGYAQMIKHFTDANAVTLKYTGTTYHAYAPETKNSHIDFCFTNDKITPIETTLLDQSFDGKYPSDHFGLLFKLKI